MHIGETQTPNDSWQTSTLYAGPEPASKKRRFRSRLKVNLNIHLLKPLVPLLYFHLGDDNFLVRRCFPDHVACHAVD
jgi:hypothetical protein